VPALLSDGSPGCVSPSETSGNPMAPDNEEAAVPNSDKHNPRLDDQLVHETEGLTHGAPDEGRIEFRRQEAPGDGEPELTIHRDVPTAAEVPDDRDLDLRSRLATFLPPQAFPAHGADLREHAREAFAPPEVLELVERLADDETFATVGDVWASAHGGPVSY
jgi:hypothetical protein